MRVQNKLLNMGDLVFKKACSITETMEGVDRNTQEFDPSSSETIQINKAMELESKSTER